MLSFVLWENVFELIQQMARVTPYFLSIEVGLPLILLVVAGLRGKGGGAGEAENCRGVSRIAPLFYCRQVGTDKIWGYGIASMVRAMTAHGKAPTTEVRHYLRALESKTTAPVAPVVQVVHKGEGEGEGKAEKDKAVLPKEIKVSGSAVLRHYKLTGWLDEKETRGLLWVTGKVKSGIIVVPAPESQGKLVAFEIIRAKAKVRPEMTDGKLAVTVEVREEGNLAEEQPDSVDITKPGILKELEEGKKTAIEDEIKAAEAQELNADTFDFGEAVRRKYPKEWKQLEEQWDVIFPTLEVNMDVNAKIRRTGKITKAAEPKP